MLVVQSRQSGKSTIYSIYCAWRVNFYSHITIGIMGHVSSLSHEILSRVKDAFEMMPFWLQTPASVWNVTSIQLENKSKIITSGMTKNAFTGQSLDDLIMDEVAKYPTNIIEPLKESLFPTVTSNQYGKIFQFTTPFGDNFFKNDFILAIKNK
jgi:hypothetical protein